MPHDRRNAALIASCILAVVVGAAFFPAAGYGDYPDREAVDEGYYVDGATGPGGTSGGDLPDADDEGSADEGDDESAADGDDTQDDENVSDGDDDARADDGDENASDDPADGPESTASDSPAVGSILVLGTLLVAVGAVVSTLWRFADPTRDPGVSDEDLADLPDGRLPRLRLRLRRIPQATMLATIGASRALPAAVDGLSRVARGVGAGLGALSRDVGGGVVAALAAVPSGLAFAVGGLGRGLSLSTGLSSLFAGIRSRRRRRSRPSRDARASGPAADPDPEPEPEPETIEEMWEELRSLVPVRRRRSRTPGEYARAAVERGLPADAVSRLTEAFREVRYGDYPPTPDRTRRARDAYERIERAASRDGDDGAGGERA
ncbi:DUF4129 domain-containing protein [Salinilacihabitans rarus]|uniref:DUF4129 domain-containing protein n=1 Tax=Salinilacihabitans rarus TaxID=2961596 RepID=UPI0020C87F84|nr:DUF4129 domain-containing protein [Salinilacihabitans rarus]